ncbi:MAG TPA: DUF4175 family protein [Phycisphaerae bacterium]|nr:DUF4175 family protein [Phycisphaerae bacterium]HUT58768.1 DUF4175 family protein [Phycisphaerae bacterium]
MTDTIATDYIEAVPDPIVQTLRRLIRRVRLVILARGGCAVAAVALGSILAAMAIDASITFFSAWPRWALSMSVLGLTVLTALWLLVRPLRRTYTLAGIARVIESRHPELQERISSAVELLASKDAPELRGSDALIAALAAEACRDARGVRVRREVTLRSIRPFIVAAAVLAAVLSGVFLAWPEQATHAWVRVMAPFQDRPNVFGYQLHITPGDIVIAAGDPLQVEVDVDNSAVKRAAFHRSSPDGPDSLTEMTPLPAKEGGRPRFAVTCPPVGQSFRYRIHAGDALSRYYTVTVVPRPSVARLDLMYEYPDYTGRPSEALRDVAGDIRAPAGTRVTLSATTNTPVTSAELIVNDRLAGRAEIIDTEGGSTVCKFQFALSKKLQGRWTVNLVKSVGEHQFVNSMDWHSLEVVPDAAPIVKITRPEDLVLKLKPTARLPIYYAAGDDYGLTHAELLVEVDGQALRPRQVPISQDPNARAAINAAVLDLNTLNAYGAGQITFRIRALDNLPEELGGPQEGFSALHTIQLDSAAFSYGRQVVLSEELALREVLLQVLGELKAAKTDSVPLRKVLQKLADPNDAAAAHPLSEANIERIDRICKHLGAADEAVREIMPRLVGGSFTTMVERLTDLVNNHVARAHNLTGQIKLSDRPPHRGELADEADFQIDRSIALVQEMLRDLKVLAEVAARAEELTDLALREAELAKQMEQMLNPTADQLQAATQPSTQPGTTLPSEVGELAGGKPMTPEQWQKQQQEVASRLAEMVRQSTKAMQQELGRSQEKTKDLAAEARKLSSQQTSTADLTKQIGQLDKGLDDLKTLAKQQAALAQQADKLPSQQAPTMSKAADDLDKGKPSEAIEKQKAAEAGLTQQADKLSRQSVTGELARQAERIAQQQQSVADQAARANESAATAATKAQAAAAQAKQADRQQQADKGKLATELTKLQKRQQALAGETANLEKDVQANPATPSARAVKPSGQMKAAADSMTPEKLAQAVGATSKAVQQADGLAKQLAADKAKAADSAKLDKETRSAQADSAKAGKAVQAAETASKSGRETAKAADAKAAQADKKAKDAEAAAAAAKQAADKAVAAKDKDAQAKTAAAQAAAKAANDAGSAAGVAKTHAQAMKQAADRLAQAAKKTTDQAAAADKKLKDLQKTKADRAKILPQVAKLSDQAGKVAAAQKKIDSELAELAGLAAKTGKSAAQAAQAKAEQDRQTKAADSAKEAMAKLTKSQQDLQKQTADLAKKAKEATEQARQAVARHNPSADMQQAAAAMQRKQGPRAAKAAEAAAAKAKQLAQALRQADAQSSPVAKDAAGKAAELAKAQAELRKKTEQAAQALKNSADSLAAQQWARLRAEQAQVAKDAVGMTDRVKTLSPQADRLDTKAARAASEASRQFNAAGKQPQKLQAAKAAETSGQTLGQLAGRLGADAAPAGADANGRAADSNVAVAGSMEQEPEQLAAEVLQQTDDAKRRALAKDAANLARRQQLIAKQAKALAENRPLEAVQPEQARITDRTAQLADDVDLIRMFAADLIPDASARQDANMAAQHVEKALKAQRRAAAALAAGAPGKAEPQQRGSAASLTQAAAALESLGQKVAAMAQKLPPGQQDPEGGQLADAFEAAEQASQEARDADLAAKLLAQLARLAADRAQSMGITMYSMQGQAMFAGMAGGGVGLIPVDLLVGQLNQAGLTIADWGKLPGELRNEILQAAGVEGPEEYRQLIKRYLEEVAKRGSPHKKEPRK